MEIDIEDVGLAYKLVEFSILSQYAIYNTPETISMLMPISSFLQPTTFNLSLPPPPSASFVSSSSTLSHLSSPAVPFVQPAEPIEGRKMSFADFNWYKREYHEFAVKMEMSKARNCLSDKNKLKIEGMKQRLIEMSMYSIVRSRGKEKTLWKKEHEDLLDLIKLFDS